MEDPTDDAIVFFRRCADDPVFFAKHVLGVDLCAYQCDIIRSVQGNRKTAVRSCHGVGKTFVSAVIVLWFLYTKPGAKVITTAPTWRQVKDLLWTEVRGLHARAQRLGVMHLGGDPSSTRLEVEPEWFATGLSSNIVENFLGYHAPFILFLADEASGVDQEILDAAKGYATNAEAYELYVGNPTQVSGGLHAAFTTKKEQWSGIHVSAFHSPNFSEKNVAKFPTVKEYMERKGIPYSTETVPDHVASSVVGPQYVADALADWGEESPLFAVKVLGEFPSTADNTVVSLGMVEAAMARYEDWQPTTDDKLVDLTCDVARFGSDETVIGRIDIDPYCDRVSIMEAVNGRDTMKTAGALVKHARELRTQGYTVRRIVVDDAGVGGGVTDRLRELQQRDGTRPATLDPRIKIVAFNGGHEPRSKNEYPNRRSEAWFMFSEQLPRVALQKDDKLLADLVAPTYTLDSRGRRVVEQKKETKKRLGRSPDRADTVLMQYASVGPVKGRKAKRRIYK